MEGVDCTCAVYQLGAGLILNKETYFSVKQQPILQLIDNCTSSTIPFPCLEISSHGRAYGVNKVSFNQLDFKRCNCLGLFFLAPPSPPSWKTSQVFTQLGFKEHFCQNSLCSADSWAPNLIVPNFVFLLLNLSVNLCYG